MTPAPQVPPGHLDTLRQMWRLGFNASRIAEALECTRAAVIKVVDDNHMDDWKPDQRR